MAGTLLHPAICNARMLKISLKWILLWVTVYGRNPSTMEATSKIIVSMGAEFYTVPFEVGFSEVLSSVNCTAEFAKSLFIGLARSKAGPR